MSLSPTLEHVNYCFTRPSSYRESSWKEFMLLPPSAVFCREWKEALDSSVEKGTNNSIILYRTWTKGTKTRKIIKAEWSFKGRIRWIKNSLSSRRKRFHSSNSMVVVLGKEMALLGCQSRMPLLLSSHAFFQLSFMAFDLSISYYNE